MSVPRTGEAEVAERTEPTVDTDQEQSRLLDRAYTEFAPMVGVPTIATAGFWLGTGAEVRSALSAALAVLIVVSPVAAGLATRTVRLIATRRARRLGAHLPRSSTVDIPRRVDIAILAGSTALTDGAPKLVAVHTTDGVSEHTALRQAGAVAAAVTEDATDTAPNPPQRTTQLLRTIATAARAQNPDLPDAAEVDRCAGVGARGIVAEVNGDRVIAHAVLVGRTPVLADHDISLDERLTTACDAIRAAGHLPIAVAWDGQARAVLEIADPLLTMGIEAIRRLRESGFLPVLLCEYDPDDARELAADLHVSTESVISVAGQVDQVSAVRRLQRAGHVVAVVGDSTTAAGALASADLPLAVGSPPAWGATTLERADPAVMVNVLRMIRGSSRTVGRNRWWVLGFTLTAVPLAAAGVLNPLAAAVATVAATGYVLVNSLLPYR